jgi:hypothetical protein
MDCSANMLFTAGVICYWLVNDIQNVIFHIQFSIRNVKKKHLIQMFHSLKFFSLVACLFHNFDVNMQ